MAFVYAGIDSKTIISFVSFLFNKLEPYSEITMYLFIYLFIRWNSNRRLIETFYFQYSNTSYITANNNNGERQRCVQKRYSINRPIHSYFIFIGSLRLLRNRSVYTSLDSTNILIQYLWDSRTLIKTDFRNISKSTEGQRSCNYYSQFASGRRLFILWYKLEMPQNNIAK